MSENSEAGFYSAIVQETNSIDPEIKHKFLLYPPLLDL